MTFKAVVFSVSVISDSKTRRSRKKKNKKGFPVLCTKSVMYGFSCSAVCFLLFCFNISSSVDVCDCLMSLNYIKRRIV